MSADSGNVHDLVEAVRDQAGVPAGQEYRIPAPQVTPAKPTPTPTGRDK